MQTVRFRVRHILLLLNLLYLPLASGATEVITSQNPKTGLWIWKVEHEALGIELAQLHGDFLRAVFASKGLPADMLEEVASYCAYGTIVKNLSDHPLSYRVADWRAVTSDGAEHRLKTKTDWVSEWRQAGVTFRWLMLADEVTFEIGDWVQGFTTVKLPRGTTFDLRYTWTVEDKTHAAVIKNVECSPDQLPPPR